MESPLKMAFEKARQEENIDLVLPVLLRSKLFAMGTRTSPSEVTLLFSESPNPDRLCVSVSETSSLFENMEGVEIVPLTGGELLRKVGNQFEVIINYAEGGGDYLTKEQILWFFQMLSSLANKA